MNIRTIKLCAASALLAACTTAPVEERQAVSDADLKSIHAVMQRDFHARGIAAMTRIDIDEVQRACNLHHDAPPAELAKSIEDAQMRTVKFPAGSLLGDWKSGKRIAENGGGMQWNNKPGQASGGSCYNCHQLSREQESYGTLGPSLLGFGKVRGYGPDIQKYAYGKIYNAKAYNACSQMPRMGHSGTLTEQQIKDLVAYLMDPASPVNK
jgi:sulfur-oxidizing protein SoxX